MIENCHHDKIVELNLKTIPCCLKHLITMYHISEEYLVCDKFGKYLLKTFKNIFDKEKIFIKNNSKSNNIYNDFFLMISKHMSYFYFINKTKLGKYLCKIAFNYAQENNNNKNKLKDINIIKSNLSCLYYKERRYDKAFNISKELYNSNNNNSSNVMNNDNLIILNNYINLYIKSKKKIDKEISSKINILKISINQKINQILPSSKIYESNKTSIIKPKKELNNNNNIQEIHLYLFIYFNYCNIYSKINNYSSHCVSNYKKGYELCSFYFGENHHLSLKYKNIITKTFGSRNNNKKILMTKYEINSKLSEINNRLEKIGKSIIPVKKIISNYKNNKKDDDYHNDNIFNNYNNNYNNQEKDKENEEEKNDNDNIYENNEENKIKIEMPKIVINLNNDNNDDLVCETLYQENIDSENEYEKEEEKEKENKIKEENVPKIFVPQINVNLDETNNDDYVCETFFIPVDDTETEPKIKSKKNNNSISISLNIPTNNTNKDNNINNNEKEEKLNTNMKLIDNQLSNQELLNKYFIDIKFYHAPFENNYQTKEDIFDITNFLSELKDKIPKNKNDLNNNNIIDYKLRIYNNINYLIKLEVLPDNNIRLFLSKKDNNDEIMSTQYSFKKLSGLYKIIRHDLSLPFLKCYYDYDTYKEFITKNFLYFITINKEKDQYKFKMGKKPLGLCHSSIIITLYFSKVVFDIMAISYNYCKIILSSENDDFNSMIVDTFFDKESFDLLINEEIIKKKNKIFFLKNNDLNNNEIILEIIKNLQKCFNSFCSGVVNTFDDLYMKANFNQKKIKELLVFKLDIRNKLKDMKLSVCEFGNKLCKVITVNQNLEKLKGIIYSYQIEEYFGYDTNFIWNKLYNYQKLIFGQIILNSIIYNEENSRLCINKYNIIDEYNFVFKTKVCNFCLINLNDVFYIKFMLYDSLGTFEFTKIIFINKSDNIDLNKLKFRNIKDKLFDEVNKSLKDLNEHNDELFSYMILDSLNESY